MQKNKTAFSAVEMVLILFILGMLVAGVVIAKKDTFFKIGKNNITQATLDSPLKDMSDLVIWYDVATDRSFKQSEMVADEAITLWKNTSPEYLGKYNATPSTNAPIYAFDDKDNMPLLKFDSSDGDDVLVVSSLNGYEIAKTNQVTIFMVGKIAPNIISDVTPFSWESGPTNAIYPTIPNLSGDIVWHFGSDQISTTPTNLLNRWKIFTFTRTDADEGEIRVDGKSLVKLAMSNALDINIGSDLFIGLNSFNGDLREIAIFNRALTSDEIKEVEKYLSHKWDIELINS